MRPLSLEEVSDIVPAFGRGGVDIDRRQRHVTFFEILALTGEHTFV